MTKITLRPAAQILDTDDGKWVPEVGEAVRHPTGKGVVMLPPDVNGVIIVLSSDGDTEGEYKRVAAIACRSITTQEDRAVEEMYRDAQLADCVGFTQGMATALYRSGYRKQPPQPAEDMNDPANWRAGDIVEYAERYEIIENKEGDVIRYIDSDGAKKWIDADKLRFHSRP